MSTTHEWFRSSFGARYRQLYAHRSEAEAERAMNALFGGEQLIGRSVLDLGCGAGRHLRVLARRGARAFGIDLSPTLLAEARHFGGLSLMRGDMRRIPLHDRSVDVVLSMFTSFGYFDSSAEHAQLALEMCRVARAEIVIDLPDPDSLRLSLVRRSERQLDDARVFEERWLEEMPMRVCKSTRVVPARAGQPEESYVERVMLFARAELERFFAAGGFGLRDAYGDYDGSPHVAGSSARQLYRFVREG